MTGLGTGCAWPLFFEVLLRPPRSAAASAHQADFVSLPALGVALVRLIRPVIDGVPSRGRGWQDRHRLRCRAAEAADVAIGRAQQAVADRVEPSYPLAPAGTRGASWSVPGESWSPDA